MKTKNPSAWICTNEPNRQTRGRLKTYQPGSKIYLNNGDEFEIELFNPTSINVKAEISIDGKPITKGGLIVRTGERIYLECFPESKKKFTFKTYKVDGSDEEVIQAISNNGRVEIKFYNEKIFNNYVYCNTWSGTGNNWINLFNTTTGKGSSGINGYSTNDVTLYSNNNSNVLESIYKELSEEIETGQVSGGIKSNQEFIEVDMSFELFPIQTYNFQILPMSQKPVSKNDFKKPKKAKPTSDKLNDLLILTDLFEKKLIDEAEYIKLKSELI